MSFKDHFQISDLMTIPDQNQHDPNKKVWVNFLPNIDFGHLLTMIGFTGALLVQWNAMDKRITIIEEQLKVVSAQYAEARSDNKGTLNEVRTDVKMVKDSLNDIKSAMAITQYRLELQTGKK